MYQFSLPPKEQLKGARDIWEKRSRLFHVVPKRSPSMATGREPLKAELDVSGQRAGDVPPILTIAHEQSAGSVTSPVFINFRHGDGNGTSIGNIELTTNGPKLNSTAGDFAEWHELACPVEQIEEEDVVYITSCGKATRMLASNCKMAGIVSGRAVVTGSRPNQGMGAQAGVEIAYCGRVPVRCHGPVAEGDVLVASGDSDGVARVSSNYRNQDVAGALDCCAQPPEAKPREFVVGVAMTRLVGPHVGSVEVVVTPPSMTSAGRISSAWWLSSGHRGSRLLPLVACVMTAIVGLLVATICVYIAIQVVLHQETAKGHQPAQPAQLCIDDPEAPTDYCELYARNGECSGDRADIVKRHCPRSCKVCHSGNGDSPLPRLLPPPTPPPPPPPPSPVPTSKPPAA